MTSSGISRRGGIRLPAPRNPQSTIRNPQSTIRGFVFTHCAPWPEVVRASFDDQQFRESALIFCGGLTPADFQTAFRSDLTEDDIEAKILEIDGRDGRVDGKIATKITNCTACGRPTNSRRGSCVMCGVPLKREHQFES